MVKGANIPFLILYPVLTICLMANFKGNASWTFGKKSGALQEAADTSQLPQKTNHVPKVRITAPVKGGRYAVNSMIHYTIVVSDAEDGDSRYNEILPKEIFLRVQYFKDTSRIPAHFNPSAAKQQGISAMEASNCFNCHNMKSSLIGPSFEQINHKYPHTDSSIQLLTARVLNGSKGIWGSAVMPTHKELTVATARQMIQWIMDHGADAGLNYYTGNSGMIRLQPTNQSSQGLYVLTASYTDHGLKNIAGKRLTGIDNLIIRLK